MADVMMALGDYRFSIDSAAYQTLRRRTSWRWPEQEVIGADPRHHYIGPGLEEIELEGTIHPHFKGGLGQVHTMRAMAERGAPLSLVSGAGQSLGAWAITEIEDSLSHFINQGRPLKITFRLMLKRCHGTDASAPLRVSSSLPISDMIQVQRRSNLDNIPANLRGLAKGLPFGTDLDHLTPAVSKVRSIAGSEDAFAIRHIRQLAETRPVDAFNRLLKTYATDTPLSLARYIGLTSWTAGLVALAPFEERTGTALAAVLSGLQPAARIIGVPDTIADLREAWPQRNWSGMSGWPYDAATQRLATLYLMRVV